jgi:hydrogen peroxide-dependent heme synthase
MAEETIYASYPVFKMPIGMRFQRLNRADVAAEVSDLLDSYSDRVTTRGVYSTAGFTTHGDLMMWWVGKSADDIQDLTVAFRNTVLGQSLAQTHAFLGLVRPAEFAKDHLPAFIKGTEPKKYMTVYPFIRTADWYLLEPDIRGKLLREHGEAGREFSDILANTTSAFGLGDYEWILCFEADGPDRLVELIRRLRSTEARRYTKLEIPFVTGIRKSVRDAVNDLP